jgi:hypothetical protein
MQLLLTIKRHFTVAVWMPVRLSATAPPSLNGCDTPWRDVSRRELNLMEDILSTCYKGTLSTITPDSRWCKQFFFFDIWNSFTKFVHTFQVLPVQLDLPEVICVHISHGGHFERILWMHFSSYNSQIKCFWTRVDTDISSCSGILNSYPKFSPKFLLHPAYITHLIPRQSLWAFAAKQLRPNLLWQRIVRWKKKPLVKTWHLR